MSMPTREVIEMMQRCAADIRRLRAERDALSIPAKAFHVISDIVESMARRGASTVGEDVLWILEKRIRELEVEIAPKPQKPLVPDLAALEED